MFSRVFEYFRKISKLYQISIDARTKTDIVRSSDTRVPEIKNKTKRKVQIMSTTRIETNRINSTLTGEQIAEAQAHGKAWAEVEIECWKDQHEGSMTQAPDWVRGNAVCSDRSLSEIDQSAWEDYCDDAAIVVWNAAR